MGATIHLHAMYRPLRRSLAATLLCALVAPTAAHTQQAPAFEIEEASIAELQGALRAGTLTCRAIVQRYLDRIAAYDRNGPAINAIVLVNPDALAVADSLDRRFAATRRFVGPLHCVPTIVKDNMDTRGLQTTAGSLSLAGNVPEFDAFQVRRIREAGAIVLAKSNMAEFAFSPYETVSSILPGYTRNPYALDRVTAGSSGGTAAAVAASFGAVGLGTDTGNSIRGPSSHNDLVGIRSTMGLTSRAGIAPLNLYADIAGPMARTVADAVAVFQVVAGYDPDDPATAVVRGRPIPDYSAALVADGLRGARIGVLRQAYERPNADREVLAVFERALAELRAAGATVIDTVVVPELDSLLRAHRGRCNPFEAEINAWLASQRPAAPMKDLDAIIRSGRYHPSIQKRLEVAQLESLPPERNPGCRPREALRASLGAAVERAMTRDRLDALVYPTWSNVPRRIGDLNTPAGDNSQLFSPATGFPAVNVPMGFTRGGTLPAGMTIFGRPFSEETLIRLAYSYEQHSNHRRPPPSVPPLRQAGAGVPGASR